MDPYGSRITLTEVRPERTNSIPVRWSFYKWRLRKAQDSTTAGSEYFPLDLPELFHESAGSGQPAQ